MEITSTPLKGRVKEEEMLVSSLINCGWGYNQLKNFINENSIKQIAI